MKSDKTTDEKVTKKDSAVPLVSQAKKEPTEHSHGLFSIVVISLLFGFLGGFLATSLISKNAIENTQTPSTQILSAESEAVTKVAREVSPSVVSITVRTSVSNPFFFRDFEQEGAGTGIILTEDGLIMTNRHVVPENATSLSVVLSDGTQYEEVEIVDRDFFNDIAFLQIKNVSGLTPARLGDSGLVEVGEKVIAIGNALGQYANTVTSGIISGLGRPIVAGDAQSFESLNNLFQTDAAINPGNSGGPLVNINGEVIGVNTAVAGNAENIGFAIPINDTKSAISSVQEFGRIVKPYLGVRYVSLTSDIAKALELDVERGAYLYSETGSAILPGSPAQDAGLQDEDVIIQVNEVNIDERNTLSTLLSQYGVGDKINLKVIRVDSELNIEVTLAEAPSGTP